MHSLRRWNKQKLVVVAVVFFFVKKNTHKRTAAAAATAEEEEEVRYGRLTNEIVVLSRSEFESAGLGRERAKRDGEVHEFVRLVTHGDDPWIGVGNAASVVLFFWDVVDDVLFSVVLVCSRSIDGADDVYLVVFEGDVVFVDVNNMIRIVYPESRDNIKEK